MDRKKHPALPDGFSVELVDDEDGEAAYRISPGACPDCKAAGEYCGRAADDLYATEEQATAAAWLWAAYFDAFDALKAYQKASALNYESD